MGNLVGFAPTGWSDDSYVTVVPRIPACKICGDPNDHNGKPHSAVNDRWEDRYQYLYNSFATTRSEAVSYAERYLQRLRGEAY